MLAVKPGHEIGEILRSIILILHFKIYFRKHYLKKGEMVIPYFKTKLLINKINIKNATESGVKGPNSTMGCFVVYGIDF